MKKRHLIAGILLLGHTTLGHAATPTYAGKWTVNLSRRTGGSCNNVLGIPGKDVIAVTQKNKKITFKDTDNNHYSGQTTSTGFMGTFAFTEKGIRETVTVSLNGVKGKKAGTASALMIFKRLSNGASCNVRYTGNAKKLK